MDQQATNAWSRRLAGCAVSRWRWLERVALAPFPAAAWFYGIISFTIGLTLLIAAIGWLLQDPSGRALLGPRIWKLAYALVPMLVDFGAAIAAMWTIRRVRAWGYAHWAKTHLECVREELSTDRVTIGELVRMVDPPHPPSRRQLGPYAIFIELRLILIAQADELPRELRTELDWFLGGLATRFATGRPHPTMPTKRVYGFTYEDIAWLEAVRRRYQAWLDTRAGYRGTRLRVEIDTPAAEEAPWLTGLKDLARFGR